MYGCVPSLLLWLALSLSLSLTLTPFLARGSLGGRALLHLFLKLRERQRRVVAAVCVVGAGLAAGGWLVCLGFGLGLGLRAFVWVVGLQCVVHG